MTISGVFAEKIDTLKGIGPAKAEKLHASGIFTVRDVLFNYPYRYEDRRDIREIKDLTYDGKFQGFVGMVSSRVALNRNGRKAWCSFEVSDNNSKMRITFFNAPYVNKIFTFGSVFIFWGIPTKVKTMTVINPVYEKYEAEKKYDVLVPVYRNSAKLGKALMRSAVSSCIQMLRDTEEYLPRFIMNKYGFCSIYDAMKNVHFPDNDTALEQAKLRLTYEEIFILRCIINQVTSDWKKSVCNGNTPKQASIAVYLNNLPYKLTEAQENAVRDISADMDSFSVMNRLVQGDVGCGKSIVAYLAILKATESGFQACMMAPTEILASQLYQGFTELFDIPAALLTGKMKASERKELLEKISDSSIKVVFGTHAVIGENVKFNNLGLAVADEQQRFGVEQRKLLSAKGDSPDILIMSATPIPRSLGLVIYGDMDCSIINMMPPGRKPVKTYIVNESMRERINAFMIKNVTEGKKVYVVCPLVEEGEEENTENLASVEDVYQRISLIARDNHVLKPAFIYGKMKKADKESVMENFRNGNCNILVSTTVIEVGVNVPDAGLMIIENGERFGLSQLHQLRGRVGRSSMEAFCVIFDGLESADSKARLEVLHDSTDGFYIAEKDLEFRGPGNFFGTDQHGLPPLKMQAFFGHSEILKEVTEDMKEIEENSLSDREIQLLDMRKEYELSVMRDSNYFIG